MADQVVAKKALQVLIKDETLGNKLCIDCPNPNPQWASLSFAVFLCLQCAGIHRGFGVHISFVRSVSMDTWQDEQIRRMQLAGNKPFQEFLKTYPAEGGYTDQLSPHDKYHCHAATQYREKLDAELAGREWAPSAAPPSTPSLGGPGRPSSAQGTRKSRTSTRSTTGSGLRGDSASPASFSSNTFSPQAGLSEPFDQKSANETYFDSLGQANASRPDDLPPSQGGRYSGFGSTPSPSMGSSQHPSYGLSSANAPTMNDLQNDPMAALGKGWSLFSAAVAGASRAVTEKVTDPTFQAGVMGYVSEAQKIAESAGTSANQWSKQQFGVDVGAQVGAVRSKMGGGPAGDGYGAVGDGYNQPGGQPGSYRDEDDDDFFGQYDRTGATGGYSDNNAPAVPAKTTAAPATKKDDDWDDW